MNVAQKTGIEAVDHVVAIGASAGGLEALEALFDHLPTDTGAAFVVITHLSPDFKSIMDELLARRTAMPVHVVEDGEALGPNRVAVIPPGKDMMVQNGRLFLSDRQGHGGPSAPIDLFFGALARAMGRRATAVILSGTGTDGARGAKALRAAGGYVIAQAPETARFDGMPRAVLDGDGADEMLAPEAVGPALAARIAALEAEDEAHPAVAGAEPDLVGRVLELVLGGAHVDFSEYKKTTILRRIARRIQAVGAPSLPAYVAMLERSQDEARTLAEDLLIVVTEFFRDPPAWDLLAATVMPELVAAAGEDRPVRIWVPGVGTGQEAYSLAMLLREAADAAGREPKVQIFATDISPGALDRAGAGVYSETEMTNVSAERRRAWFKQIDDGLWQVAPPIRNWIVFATHNMLRDPPFINTGLISCRNALIYLEPSAQEKALSLFHFSLASGGWLLLGPSESVGEDGARFAPVDPRWRLFRKRPADRRDAAAMGELIAGPRWTAEAPRRRTAPPPRPAGGGGLQAVADLFCPPGLLITRERELAHVVGDAQRHLMPPSAGPFTRDVVRLVRPGLRAPLATAVERALRSGETVAFAASDDPAASVADALLTAHPLPGPDGTPDRVFVAFGPAPERAETFTPTRFDEAAEQRIAYLEDALKIERDNLQAMLEQLETSNEELQSANEELMTANEELQSTNEELHSVNEELYTVNAEYERKNDELGQLSRDVSSLLQATGVGVLFVDRALTVRRFTPMATRVLNLQPGDEGRSLGDITHRLAGFDLCGWLAATIARGQVAEVERAAQDGAVWTVRAAPVGDARLEARAAGAGGAPKGATGAVVSLIDVSRMASAEAEAKARGAALRRLVRWVGAATLRLNHDGAVREGLEDWNNFTGAPNPAADWREGVHPDDRDALARLIEAARRGAGRFETTLRLRAPGGRWRAAALAGGPLDDGDAPGGGHGGAGAGDILIHARDAAETAAARQAATASAERARLFAEMAYAGAYVVDPETGDVELDARLAALLGLPAGRCPREAFEGCMTPASRQTRAAALARRDQTGGRWLADITVMLADGRPALMRDEGGALPDAGPGGPRLMGALAPLEGPRADAALAEEILRSSPVEVMVLDARDFRIQRANPAARRNSGFDEVALQRMRYPDLLPEYDADRFAELAAPLLDGEADDVVVETFALRRDGTTYDLSLTLRPMAGGSLIAAVGRDASARRRAEETLRRRTEALARANRELERTALTAGGDLIAPLDALAREAAAAGAEAAAARAVALRDRLRAMAALAADGEAGPGFGPDDFAPVDLTAAARAAAAEIAPTLDAAGARVEIDALPTVRGLEPFLRLAFRALFETALERADPAEPAVITVTAGEGRSAVVFAPGRAEAAAGDDPRSRGPALALGWMICRRAIEAHGGDVRIDAREGEGVTTTLVFP